jgi:cysteine desulfurase
MIYLDHAATTPLRPEALEAMRPWLTTGYGNPSGTHSLARAALRAVDEAREQVAGLLGGEPGEVVFTSGGTEAANLAVAGATSRARAGRPAGGATSAAALCCSAVEHPAVLEPTRTRGGELLGVDAGGIVDPDSLSRWLSGHAREASIASVMLVNNETGVLQPLAELAAMVREAAPEVLVHTDAVQAAGWLDLAQAAGAADLVSVSAHKFGGPKGTGALLVRRPARGRLHPLLRGGPQERELRAGTHNVAGIVGMGRAAELVKSEPEELARVARLGDRFVAGVLSAVDAAAPAVPRELSTGTICNLGFEAIEAEELLLMLDSAGVCASAGSSCASGAVEPSHVLMAMGLSAAQARSHVRFSLGHPTTQAEVDQAVVLVAEAVAKLRSS